MLQKYASKVISAEAAIGKLKGGERIFTGTACATPLALLAALENTPSLHGRVELVHFLSNSAHHEASAEKVQTHFKHRVFFVGSDIRNAVKQGIAEYVPISVVRVPDLMRQGKIKVDVAFIQVSSPDAFGYVSLGVSVDIVAAAAKQARMVIAEVNPNMPKTMGDSTIHIDDIDYLVPVSTPVFEYHHQATNEDAVARIAQYISSVIDDGSTIQIGMGRYANEAMKFLLNRSDLGIHSDVITDSIIPLIEKGIVSGKRKSDQPNKVVTSLAIGSRRLYDLIDANPLFSFQPIDAICKPEVIARQYKMVSVTQAFSIDLAGQVCVEQLDGEYYGGIAAQQEFVRGALRSEGGKAIICLASTQNNEQSSNIRVALKPGEVSSISRTEVQYVITEFGVAYLYGKSVRERALALIQIAHPKFRDGLLDEAKRYGYVSELQTLQNQGEYLVEVETALTLKDRRTLLMRPVVLSDAAALRDMFYDINDPDVFRRLFDDESKVDDETIQELCNLNFESDVAFVAVSGTREQPEVVAHCNYFIDPSTKYASAGLIVHPQWRKCGLGTHMLEFVTSYAKFHGARGLVFDVYSTNSSYSFTNMLMKCMSVATVSMEMDGDCCQVYAIF